MGRCTVHTRIVFGVAAWVLGAGTATAGSLLAVSLLGQGITGGSGQLVSQDAVNRALASEAAEAAPSASPVVAASTTPPPARPAATPSSAAPTMPATPTMPTTPAAAITTAVPTMPTDGTVLTSSAGEVVAACPPGGAYLVSWSPLQGYEVGDVARGPATTARAEFESTASRVTMVVSCSAGVPSATSYTHSGGDT
jgi:hypothetical protein